jgi:hypothetical protein
MSVIASLRHNFLETGSVVSNMLVYNLILSSVQSALLYLTSYSTILIMVSCRFLSFERELRWGISGSSGTNGGKFAGFYVVSLPKIVFRRGWTEKFRPPILEFSEMPPPISLSMKETLWPNFRGVIYLSPMFCPELKSRLRLILLALETRIGVTSDGVLFISGDYSAKKSFVFIFIV